MAKAKKVTRKGKGRKVHIEVWMFKDDKFGLRPWITGTTDITCLLKARDDYAAVKLCATEHGRPVRVQITEAKGAAKR